MSSNLHMSPHTQHAQMTIMMIFKKEKVNTFCLKILKVSKLSGEYLQVIALVTSFMIVFL